MGTTAWRCRRCKADLADWIDADWHNVTTGHNYFEVPKIPLARPMLVNWRKQMGCNRAAS